MFKIIAKSDYRRATWKNGLGHTDEIAIFPPGAELRKGDFLWRLSSARIEQASPFSSFPEHDRILVILKGAGVSLTHEFDGDQEKVELPPLSPYEFPGDIQSHCELTDGGVTDLSVFIRKGQIEAVADVAELSDGQDFAWEPSGRWNFVFAVDGDLSVSCQGQTETLRAGDTLRLDLEAPSPEALQIQSLNSKPARLVTVSLQG